MPSDAVSDKRQYLGATAGSSSLCSRHIYRHRRPVPELASTRHVKDWEVATEARTADDAADPLGDEPRVDPRAPRFGQALTTVALAGAVALDQLLLLYAVTAALVAAVASGWRVDLHAALFRHGVRRFLPPAEPEPAAPHRFARVVGAAGTLLASALVLAGVPLAGYAVAGGVAVAAGLAASTGFCLGCRMYAEVAAFRRLGLV